MLLCEFGLYSKFFITLKSDSSDLGIIALVLAMFKEKSLHMTQFRVFGGGWLQSTTFLGSFSFHDYSVFIGFYASLYIGNEETYKTF